MERTAGRIAARLKDELRIMKRTTLGLASGRYLLLVRLPLFGSPSRQGQLMLFSLRQSERILDCQNRSRQSGYTNEFTSFWIACRQCDFRAFCHRPRGASAQTSAGNGRNLRNTDVDKRGRAYHRCHIKYLDVATLLRSELNRRGRKLRNARNPFEYGGAVSGDVFFIVR